MIVSIQMIVHINYYSYNITMTTFWLYYLDLFTRHPTLVVVYTCPIYSRDNCQGHHTAQLIHNIKHQYTTLLIVDIYQFTTLLITAIYQYTTLVIVAIYQYTTLTYSSYIPVHYFTYSGYIPVHYISYSGYIPVDYIDL